MENQNIDKIFKQKADNRSFEFEDDYWNDMEALLEEAEATGEQPLIRYWWLNPKFIAGSLLTVIAVGLLYFFINEEVANPLSNTMLSDKGTHQNQIIGPNTNQATQSDLILNNADNQSNTANEEEVGNVAGNSKNSPEAFITQNKTTENEASNYSKNKTATDFSNNNKNTTLNTVSKAGRNTVSNANKSGKTGKYIATSSKGKAAKIPKNSNNSAVGLSLVKSNGAALQNLVGTGRNTPNQNGRKDKATGDFINTKNGTAANTNGNESSKLGDKMAQNAKNTNTDKADEMATNNQKAADNSVTNLLENIENLDLLPLKKIDTIAYDLPIIKGITKEENEQSVIPVRKPVTLGLVAGGSRYEGLRNVADEKASNMNSAFGGVYARFPLNEKMAIGTGLTYWKRTNLNSSMQGDSTVYDFGFQDFRTITSVLELHYLEMPLSFQYTLNDKHTFLAGANISYLLTALGGQSQLVMTDFSSTSLPLTVNYGYRNWVNTVDVALMAGYQYQVVNRLNIGMVGQYGLRDITPNAVYQNTTTDRNLQIRLFASYQLFSF